MADSRESVAERIARMKREAEVAKSSEDQSIVEQLTHEGDGDLDFSELAKRLEERKAVEAKGENAGHVKMTIYVEENLAASFNALITKRGQQKQFVNQALSDFVRKKARELGLDE